MTRPSAAPKITSSFGKLLQPTGQRNLFTLISKEEFEKNKTDYEFVGVHGTTAWAVESIKTNGINLGLEGKYLGGKSMGGSGLYTASHGNIAHHYARRAGVGEMDAFDLDTRPQSVAVYRLRKNEPTVRKIPPEIFAKKEKVEAFRARNPADEYNMGVTPAPPKFTRMGIAATTTLITPQGLSNPHVKYVAVPLPIGEVFQSKQE